MAKKKQTKKLLEKVSSKEEKKVEETIDDLVEEAAKKLRKSSKEEVVTRVETETTTEETPKIYTKQERAIPRTTESELEETASEAPRRVVEYEPTPILMPITSRREENPDIKYDPTKLYESKYKPSEGERIGERREDKKKEVKVYTTKREIIS